jgi:hypothetical protein
VKLFAKLIAKAPKEPSARLAELAEAKLRLAEERAAIERQLASRDERRERMLADDKPEKEILALESEFDALHVKIEKIAAQQRYLDVEVLTATEVQTRQRWLVVHDRRLEAARQYAEALGTAQEAYIAFSAARAETLAPEFSSLYCGFGQVPVPPPPPALELFKRQIEALEDFENGRKATAIEPAVQL